MQPVYIDCHGLRQFSKVSAKIADLCETDFKFSDIKITQAIETNIKNNKSFCFYRIHIPSSNHVRLHEYLMDYLPIPSQFIWCDDYN